MFFPASVIYIYIAHLLAHETNGVVRLVTYLYSALLLIHLQVKHVPAMHPMYIILFLLCLCLCFSVLFLISRLLYSCFITRVICWLHILVSSHAGMNDPIPFSLTSQIICNLEIVILSPSSHHWAHGNLCYDLTAGDMFVKKNNTAWK